jgi:hypothetical protein
MSRPNFNGNAVDLGAQESRRPSQSVTYHITFAFGATSTTNYVGHAIKALVDNPEMSLAPTLLLCGNCSPLRVAFLT